MRSGVIAQKLGMTRVYNDNGEQLPVTVLRMENCQVVAQRTEEKNGYSAVQLGSGLAKVKNTSKAMRGVFAQASVEPKRKLVEFRVSDDGMGVERVRVWLQSGDVEIELHDETYAGNLWTGADLSLTRRIEVPIEPDKMGLGPGEATLYIEVHDFSWTGNSTLIEIPLVIDARPPRVSVLSGLTYVRRGGSEAVIYEIDEDRPSRMRTAPAGSPPSMHSRPIRRSARSPGWWPSTAPGTRRRFRSRSRSSRRPPPRT